MFEEVCEEREEISVSHEFSRVNKQTTKTATTTPTEKMSASYRHRICTSSPIEETCTVAFLGTLYFTEHRAHIQWIYKYIIMIIPFLPVACCDRSSKKKQNIQSRVFLVAFLRRLYVRPFLLGDKDTQPQSSSSPTTTTTTTTTTITGTTVRTNNVT